MPPHPRKPKPKPNLTLHLVVWEDATYNEGYSAPPLASVICAGRIEHMDDDKLVVAFEHFDDGASRHFTTIPKGMVKRITPIKVYIPELDTPEYRLGRQALAE